MVGLMADLCVERNYLAIKQVEHIYDLDSCREIVTNDAYDATLRRAFTTLLTHLWVNREPFQVIALPNYIRLWS